MFPDENPIRDLKILFSSPAQLARYAAGITLRSYQRQPATAVMQSVMNGDGLSFVVLFPRQSGKNELQAQLEVYLLLNLMERDAEMVKISPTWKPQSLNAMRRLERALERNIISRGRWSKESGYIYRMGRARISFFSGAPEAHIVGATANTLLEVDEAQDVQIAKYDKDIAPMAASTNATRLFCGTAWTSQTLLARELRAARRAQEADGIRRVYLLTADEVAAEVPAYGAFVRSQVQKLGRTHPLVRTQFYCEEIDAEGGMFPPARQMLMHGSHARAAAPAEGRVYAFLLDVGGEDEGAGGDPAALHNPHRDQTALTIAEIDFSTCSDDLLRAPTYRVVNRMAWTGVRHAALLPQLRVLIESWKPQHIVVDATGVGAGLASFLDKSFPGRVTAFLFSTASKSALGWDFLAVCDSGRYRDFDPPDALFWQQLSACQYTILEGPGRSMRWGVPDGARDPASGEPLHDDLVLSAALLAALEGRPLTRPSGATLIVPSADPLDTLDRGF